MCVNSETCSAVNTLSNYRKSSIRPPGGLFNFGHSREGLVERGLIREGELIQKLDEKGVYDRFINFFTSYLADSKYTFMSQIYQFDRF